MFRRFRRHDKVSSESMSDSEIDVKDLLEHNEISKIPEHKHALDATVTEDESCTTLVKPNVSFSDVEVRRHRLILGDNPYCEFPLGLDWEHDDQPEIMPIDRYEETRNSTRPDYTYAQDMEPLDITERQARLRRAGYTNEQLLTEERRRRVTMLIEWTYRQNRDEAVVFSAPNGANMFKHYIM